MKKSKPQTDILKKKMVEAMTSELGLVSNACKVCGISRSQYYKWRATDEKFKEAVDECQIERDDAVEEVLLHLIKKEKDPKATLFYAKSKLGHRGYGDGELESNVVTAEDFLNMKFEERLKFGESIKNKNN